MRANTSRSTWMVIYAACAVLACASAALAGDPCYQTTDDGKCGADLIGPVITCDLGAGISERRVAAEKRKCRLACGQGRDNCRESQTPQEYVCETLEIWQCVEQTGGYTAYIKTYNGVGACCPTHILDGQLCEDTEGCGPDD